MKIFLPSKCLRFKAKPVTFENKSVDNLATAFAPNNKVVKIDTKSEFEKYLHSVLDNYTLDDRYKYGFPISNIEYGTSMKKLVLSL